MRKLLSLLGWALFLLPCSHAQSIGPQVINSAGGSFNMPANNFNLDWSVGEMTLVNTMQGANATGIYVVTNGFLQPTKYGAVKGGKEDTKELIVDAKPLSFGANDVRVFPNPTINHVDVSFMFSQAGNVRLSLYNQMGQQLYVKDFTSYGFKSVWHVPMAGYVQGTYLLYVEWHATDGKSSRTDSYKIVKTN
jgi:hypothetical protein